MTAPFCRRKSRIGKFLSSTVPRSAVRAANATDMGLAPLCDTRQRLCHGAGERRHCRGPSRPASLFRRSPFVLKPRGHAPRLLPCDNPVARRLRRRGSGAVAERPGRASFPGGRHRRRRSRSDAIDRLPLRSAELIAPDGHATPAALGHREPGADRDLFPAIPDRRLFRQPISGSAASARTRCLRASSAPRRRPRRNCWRSYRPPRSRCPIRSPIAATGRNTASGCASATRRQVETREIPAPAPPPAGSPNLQFGRRSHAAASWRGR